MNTSPIRDIPLNQLRLSPRNTRRQRTPESIEAMAASLAAHGLLQNLTVEPVDGDANAFEVIAGGTRLAGLQLRATRNEVAGDVAVPCRIVANGEAIEASAAENLVRTRLAPAEEYDAFRAMADSGKSVAEIASHFGVAEIVVKRSLKLANVDPKLFAIFREGHMDLNQLQALAITDDHEAQRKAWFDVPAGQDWERNAYKLRERLTKREVRSDDRLAEFVGVDAYEQAGGPVRRDLFSERGTAYLGDRALLESLAMDKLEALAQAHRDEGWSWAEAYLSMDYAQTQEYPRGFNDDLGESYLPDGLAERRDEIEKRLGEMDDLDADEMSDEEQEEVLNERDGLEEELDAINAQRRERWPADVMAQAGVVLYVDHAGLTRLYARLKPGQKLDSGGEVTGKARETTAGTPAAKAKPKKPTLSADMQHRLRLHQEAAVRVAIADDISGALEMLLASLLSQLLANGGGGPFDLFAKNQHALALNGATGLDDYKASRARKSLDELLAALRKDGLPKKASELQPWLATRTPDQLHHIIAIVAALMFSPSQAQVTSLARLYDVDMAQWWQPTPEAYLAHVPKPLILEAVQEVHGKPAAAKLEKLKKDALVAEAAKLLANSGWLPKPLRGAGYKLVNTPAKPAPAQATKAPAKKARSKKAKVAAG